MGGGQLRAVLQHLRQAIGTAEVGGLGDAELLRRWVADRDEAAFEVLLWRHGPMVLGTCRRLLGQEQDAEDAFQATFLVLARKAGSVGKREAVGSWLYTVARRIALQARASAARRPAQAPRGLAWLPAPADDGPAERELLGALDEEVARLPALYRAPFVLCQLGGMTNESAARELGCPVGTLVSRLARARARLHERLTRRGLAAVAVTMLAHETAQGAAGPLVSDTIRAATLSAAGKAAEAVSAPVAALMREAMGAMGMNKMKITAVAFLVVAALAGGSGALTYQMRGSGTGEARAQGPAPRAGAGQPDRGAANNVARRPEPPVVRPGSGANAVELQKGHDEVELLEAQLAVKRAQIKAAALVSAAAKKRLDKLEELGMRTRHLPDGGFGAQVEQARSDYAAAQAQVAIREAELLEPTVRLKQARRRLASLEPSPTPAPGRVEERLRALERKQDALRKEIEALRLELRRGPVRGRAPEGADRN